MELISRIFHRRQRRGCSLGTGGMEAGFTMLELIIYLGLSTAVLAFMTMVFTGQSASYNEQDEIVDIQQDLRSALQLMSSELHYAGYNPTGTLNTGFTVASASTLTFSFQDFDDIDGDGSTSDLATITYNLVGTNLQRSGAVLAENIERLQFEYLFNDNTWSATGANDANGDGDFKDPGDTNPEDIVAIKIMTVGRSQRQLASSQTPIETYTPPIEAANSVAWSALPTNDDYIRRMMSVIVQLRNQGTM